MSTAPNDYGVPPPVPPDDPAAWYAPDVRAQYEVYPGVVVTIRDASDGFAYDARAPSVGPATADELDTVLSYFADADGTRPLTREGAAERMRDSHKNRFRQTVTTKTPPTSLSKDRFRGQTLVPYRTSAGVLRQLW